MAPNPLAAFKTGKGTPVPTLGSNGTGAVNINAILASMVSRDIWTYYYTLKLAAGTAMAASYSLFNTPSGQLDPYPLAAASPTPVLTHVETNMPASSTYGFPAPKDLILNRIGFYFLPGGSGNSTTTNNTTFANPLDMYGFCQYSYFEFKIIEKVFIEGYLELQPAGVGFNGYTTNTAASVVTLGLANPHATNKMGDFAKYLAPQMPWSLTIFFPPQSGPISGATPGALTLLTTAQGGNGIWLKSNLTGLTDRAVQ